MPTITPFLWFDADLEDVIAHYESIFSDAKTYGTAPGPDGKAFSADFELAGQRFKALKGGPMFPFTEAVSFFVECDDQAEVDRYWDALIADGGEEGRCGWCKDHFGLSWQVVPSAFGDLLSSGTPEQAGRVMAALQTMSKLDIAGLQAAYDG
jgi:predicted 3-demethylubiquinone-9 3-methyltransferase (glyoxalase superfamily)